MGGREKGGGFNTKRRGKKQLLPMEVTSCAALIDVRGPEPWTEKTSQGGKGEKKKRARG